MMDLLIIPIVTAIVGGLVLLIIEYRTNWFANHQKNKVDFLDSATPFKEIKKQSLEKRRSQLILEYNLLNDQLNTDLNEANRSRLQGQLNKREKEIAEVETELKNLDA